MRAFVFGNKFNERGVFHHETVSFSVLFCDYSNRKRLFVLRDEEPFPNGPTAYSACLT